MDTNRTEGTSSPESGHRDKVSQAVPGASANSERTLAPRDCRGAKGNREALGLADAWETGARGPPNARPVLPPEPLLNCGAEHEVRKLLEETEISGNPVTAGRQGALEKRGLAQEGGWSPRSPHLHSEATCARWPRAGLVLQSRGAVRPKCRRHSCTGGPRPTWRQEGSS